MASTTKIFKNVRIIWKNFSGQVNDFNPPVGTGPDGKPIGKRYFSIVLTEEMAEELRAQREAALDVEEPLAEDAVAVVGQTEAEVAEEAAASIAYAPVEGEKLKVISLKMPESLIAATDEAAAAYGEGVTRSEFIRIAIEKMVNEK